MDFFIEDNSVSLKIEKEIYKIKYLGELIIKLQSQYSSNSIDKDFFDKATEFLDSERKNISSNIKALERSLYIEEIVKVNTLRELAKVDDIIVQKLVYRVENKSVLTTYLNEKFEELINNEEIIKEFEFKGDLNYLINKANSLINNENKSLAYAIINGLDLNNKEEKISIRINPLEQMSPEEKREYLEIQKKGIELRFVEAKNLKDLYSIYELIKSKIGDNLNAELKKEFSKLFLPIFKLSSIYLLIQKIDNPLDLKNLNLQKDNLSIKNTDISVSKYECDKNNFEYIDQALLSKISEMLENPYKYFSDSLIEKELSKIIKLPKKTTDNEERISKLNKLMNNILKKDKYSFFRGTLIIDEDMYFSRKSISAKNHYKIPDNENIVVIFDNTIFRTVKNGFVVTNKKIYFKNRDGIITTIKLEDISELSINSEEGLIYIEKHEIECDVVGVNYREDFKQAVLIILYIVQNYNDTETSIAEIERDILDIL